MSQPHDYGPHSSGGDFALLYTQSQMDAMVARERTMERERCAKIAESLVSPCSLRAGCAGVCVEIAARIRSGE